MAPGAASLGSVGVRVRISLKVCTMCTPLCLPAPPAHFIQRQSSCKAGVDHQARWAGPLGGERSVPGVLERRGGDVDLWWCWRWWWMGERERQWRGLALEDGYGRRGEREGEVDMGRRWRAWWRLGEREWWWRGLQVVMGMGGGRNGEPGGACGGRGRWKWGGGGARGGARGSGSGRSGVPGCRGGAWGSGRGASGWLRRGGGVGSVGAGGECAVRGGSGSAAVCGTRGLIARVGPVRRRWRVLGGLAWCRLVPDGGGEVPRRPRIRHVGVWWRQRLVVWVE